MQLLEARLVGGFDMAHSQAGNCAGGGQEAPAPPPGHLSTVGQRVGTHEAARPAASNDKEIKEDLRTRPYDQAQECPDSW